MRGRVRLGASLLALLLAGATAVSCSRSTGGTAAPGTLTPTISSIETSEPAGRTTATSTRTSNPPSASSTSSASSPTTAITTVTVTTSATGNQIPPTDLSGEVHGFVTSVDVGKSEITLDKIDWFTGAAAAQACAEDGITSTDNNRCTGYYYRNVNPALRVVAVSPQATITTLANGVNAVPGDLSDVAGRIATSGGESNTYQLVVTDGLVTELHEMYHP